MQIVTASNTAFSTITRNLSASAHRFGLNVRVFVPSRDQIISGLDCEVVEDARVSPAFETAFTNGFGRACLFKLGVMRLMVEQEKCPFLYLDADTSIMRDPVPFLESVTCPLSFQCRDCAPNGRRNYPYCLGMAFVARSQPWMLDLFSEPDFEVNQDETLVNDRVKLLHPVARARIQKLPEAEFVLGYFHSSDKTLVYHANFCEGETLGKDRIEEEKISKLKAEGAWFL